jgi:UDP-N-acetylmuramoyl-tripeptide--D-alanyl-D-alanine ligase
MIPMLASEIAKVTGGELHGADLMVSQPPVFSSNDVEIGSIFLALQGDVRDGHDFISEAFHKGAVLAITSRRVDQRCIVVPDVTVALGVLAAHIRDVLRDLKVIAITGSQGKTTVKDLLAQLLTTVGPTIAPPGNYNNEIGAPITLLQATHETKFCILEMGARHIGDIKKLCKMATPNIGVVLKVGSAHVGEFGSPENIAQAKSEMISSLADDAVAILGLYDEFTPKMASLHKGRVIIFGETSKADIRATDIQIREGRPHFDLVTPAGRSAVGLRIVGIHQVANALAVAAVGTALDLSLDRITGSLSTSEMMSKWRMEIHELPDLLLINDSYNASPEAMESALRTLILFAQERGGEAWAFLGKMQELGESSPQDHARIGTLASEIGVDHLVCIGAPEYAREVSTSGLTQVHLCLDQSEALELAKGLSRGDVVLIKGSRSEKLEILAKDLQKQWVEFSTELLEEKKGESE